MTDKIPEDVGLTDEELLVDCHECGGTGYIMWHSNGMPTAGNSCPTEITEECPVCGGSGKIELLDSLARRLHQLSDNPLSFMQLDHHYVKMAKEVLKFFNDQTTPYHEAKIREAREEEREFLREYMFDNGIELWETSYRTDHPTALKLVKWRNFMEALQSGDKE